MYDQFLLRTFSGNPNHLHHEVIHKYTSTCKIVFDIDMKSGSEEFFQEVLDSLVGSLQDIFTNILDSPHELSKDIVLCTSHGDPIFSGHVIVQRAVHRDSHDLAHLYQLVKERMSPHLYSYIDTAFASFPKNL